MVKRGGSAALLVALLGVVEPSRAHDVVVAPPPAGVDEPLPTRSVARIGTRLVAKRSFDRWFRIAAAGRRPRPGSRRHARLRRDTMEFLIGAVWITLEAREHRITASRRAVRRAFRRQKRQVFRDERAYRRFLRRARQTERDVLYRVKVDLLSERLSRHVTSGATSPFGEVEALDRFARDLRLKWRARTACAPGYVIADCSREVPTRVAQDRGAAQI